MLVCCPVNNTYYVNGSKVQWIPFADDLEEEKKTDSVVMCHNEEIWKEIENEIIKKLFAFALSWTVIISLITFLIGWKSILSLFLYKNKN